MDTCMIAPCGVNCSVCIGHLREKNRCPGCLSLDNGTKPTYCVKCQIRYCEEKKDDEYCYGCNKYPCQKLKRLDKRYKNSYQTSLINNLEDIKKIGIEEFMRKDREKWVCKNCGSVISIHRNVCLNCKASYIKEPNYDNDRTSKII